MFGACGLVSVLFSLGFAVRAKLKIGPKCIFWNQLMDLKQIQEEALSLPEDDRAALARKLLMSLDNPSEEEIEEAWLVEASRRARELDQGIVQAVPSEDVMAKARALLR